MNIAATISSWTPQKLAKAWRIFDAAILEIANGIDVPADELRAYLIEGTTPLVQETAPVRLIDRIIECHKDFPHFTARDVAEELFADYDTVRGLAARAKIVWPVKAKAPKAEPPMPEPVAAAAEDYQAADNAILAQYGKNARFRLRDDAGYLHMQVAHGLRTDEHTYAWRGTKDQLRAVRNKYPETRRLKIVVVSE